MRRWRPDCRTTSSLAQRTVVILGRPRPAGHRWSRCRPQHRTRTRYLRFLSVSREGLYSHSRPLATASSRRGFQRLQSCEFRGVQRNVRQHRTQREFWATAYRDHQPVAGAFLSVLASFAILNPRGPRWFSCGPWLVRVPKINGEGIREVRERKRELEAQEVTRRGCLRAVNRLCARQGVFSRRGAGSSRQREASDPREQRDRGHLREVESTEKAGAGHAPMRAT